jgi:hypothetical protein
MARFEIDFEVVIRGTIPINVDAPKGVAEQAIFIEVQKGTLISSYIGQFIHPIAIKTTGRHAPNMPEQPYLI